MDEKILLKLWAKTVKENPDRYHPVLFHLLDVGNCAALLWDEVLSPVYKQHIADTLEINTVEARSAVIWLAAWHDIGKVSPGFQFIATAPQFLWPELEAVGLKHSALTSKKPHGLITTKVLLESFVTGEIPCKIPSRQDALIMAHISGAHHGSFPHSAETDLQSDVLGNGIWHDARIEVMNIVARTLVPHQSKQLKTGKTTDSGAVAWLAGLISVVDWLGSSEHFPAAGHRDRELPCVDEYNDLSREQARAAFTEYGWLPAFSANNSRMNFLETFGFAPNALQRAVLNQTQNLSSPFFAIAEEQMGAGKTEAAFAAIDAAFAQGQANGFYIALPTQATSNAMHDRVQDNYLKKRQQGNLNLMLAHSGAALKEDETQSNKEIQPTSVGQDEPEEQATVAAQSWFTFRKRPLLAPFGVGTIDQSLMGVLQTKHWFVRVFGLAGKVIVFDEVHAYDMYMSTLLERLLPWLRAEGCSVILLSATLPSSRRHALLEAWGTSVPKSEVDYPRLTWADNSSPEAVSLSVEDTHAAKKSIYLHQLSTDINELAQELRAKLQDGGCAAIICNTVNNAQHIFQELRKQLGVDFCGEENWHLFHARMPFAWRGQREANILRDFGKDKSNRPHRAIVVATQVIEQSLDLDFDWMASELAPIDLLLQRAGRLHRHAYTFRSALLQAPELCILCDVEENGIPELKVPDDMYAHYILLKTWLVLREKKVLLLPDEMEQLIEDVYERELTVSNVDWEEALNEACLLLKSKRSESKEKANNFLVKKPKSALSIATDSSRKLWEDDDPATHETMRAATRDGDPSIQVVCLIQVGDKLFLPNDNGEADESQPVDLAVNPNLKETLALLRSALPISNKLLFFALLKQGAPTGWKENSHLRFARVVKFCNGIVEVGGTQLRLDGKLGVVIERNK